MLQQWGKPCISETLFRNLNRGFYLFEVYFAAIVLGITAWFISFYEDTEIYPSGRLIYTIIVAGLAIICATFLLFVWSYLPSFLLAINNLIFSLAFFAAFGAFNEFDCVDNWHGWTEVVGKSYLACWKAAEAFCFIGAIFWLGSAFLAYPTCNKQLVQHPEKRTSLESEATEHMGSAV